MAHESFWTCDRCGGKDKGTPPGYAGGPPGLPTGWVVGMSPAITVAPRPQKRWETEEIRNARIGKEEVAAARKKQLSAEALRRGQTLRAEHGELVELCEPCVVDMHRAIEVAGQHYVEFIRSAFENPTRLESDAAMRAKERKRIQEGRS